jgi:hypothetical protein
MRAAVIDIGKPGKNLGWAIDEPRLRCTKLDRPPRDGTDLDGCIEVLAAALREDALALGFEAPQFVPVRDDQNKLLEARPGEAGTGLASRPFSAGAGPTALVTSLVIVPYVLQRLRQCVPTATATLNWQHPILNWSLFRVELAIIFCRALRDTV